MIYLKIFIYVFLAVLIARESAFSNVIILDSTDSYKINIALGIPVDKDSSDDLIIHRSQFTVSYNHTIKTTNWAAWNLNSNWIGKSGRYSGKFITDSYLPDSIKKVAHDDYTNTNYDRGHLVRSHDRTNTQENNKSTFFMSNIIPQTADLNRGVWLDFERFVEELAEKSNKELYIYAGAVYKSERFLSSGIKVPDSCYKIVVVLEKGEGLECVNYNTIIYSVMMPNIEGIRNKKWEEFATSVDNIEFSSGYDFLRKVPENIQGIIEQYIYK